MLGHERQNLPRQPLPFPPHLGLAQATGPDVGQEAPSFPLCLVLLGAGGEGQETKPCKVQARRPHCWERARRGTKYRCTAKMDGQGIWGPTDHTRELGEVISLPVVTIS